jgi:hypothetical protein
VPSDDDLRRLTDAVLRLADGTEVPVATHSFTWTPSGPSMTVTKNAPAFGLNFSGGFKFEMTPDGVEALREAVKDAPVDPAVDKQFDDWTCPGCGKGWDEIPAGHAWSLGFDLKTRKAGEYRCSDPPRIEDPIGEMMRTAQRISERLDGHE